MANHLQISLRGMTNLTEEEHAFNTKCTIITNLLSDWAEESKGMTYAVEWLWNQRSALRHLFKYIESCGYDIKDMNRKLYLEFYEFLIKTDKLANTTKRLTSSHIKIFMSFAFAKGLFSPFDLSTERFDNLVSANAKQKLRLIPSYNDIIRMRQADVHLNLALMLEIMISGGLRIKELLQLRYKDIKPGDVPYDINTGEKTRFAAASISLDAEVMSIKTKRSRLTYISKLAFKLLQLYMKLNGVDSFSSNAVIFPWRVTTLEKWYDELRSKVTFESVYSSTPVAKIAAEEFTVSPEDLAKMPKAVRDAVARRAAERLVNNVGPVNKVEYSDSFSSHCCRHAFCCIQMYRDYRGGRSDSIYVGSMLGHASDKTTLEYLKKLGLVKTDTEWKNIMTGTPRCWKNVRTDARQNKGAGKYNLKARLLAELEEKASCDALKELDTQ